MRLDRLLRAEFEAVKRNFDVLLAASSARPLILTLRTQTQREPDARDSGLNFDEDERRAFWLENFTNLIKAHPAREIFGDIELDLVNRFAINNSFDNSLWQRVICSHHDFAGVPQNLDVIFDEMKRTPARILKLAVRAVDVTDCLYVFRLLEQSARDLKSHGRGLIALAMSESGLMTRVLSPSHGAFLTYAAADSLHRTAPGQLTAREMREIYRVQNISRETQIFGLVGSPVAHSISPQMHNAALCAKQIDGVYLPFEVRDADDFFKRMVHPRTREIAWNLRGLSVTAPHKQAALKYLDVVDEAAREIGAVNTIIVKDNELHGYNTDAAAALVPLREFQDADGRLKNLRVAILGAGGATRAVLWGLRKRGASVCVFARDEKRGQHLAEDFNADFAMLDENSCFEHFDVVINATPLGTRGKQQDETPVVASQLAGAPLVYDLIYNPTQTKFMREGRVAGCRVVGGLPMLVAQAAAQFELWTKTDAPVELMNEAATRTLTLFR
ncbi:MAG: hypothetical protein NVSMB56_10070 [Pyrinomonadaceae bacterium]